VNRDDFPDSATALRRAVEGLREAHPWATASITATRTQLLIFAAIVVPLLLAAVLAPRRTATVLALAATGVYLWNSVERIIIFQRGLQVRDSLEVPDHDALAIPYFALPIYTILVPAYGEPAVIGTLITNLMRLNYPPSKLDIKLLLEEDDTATIAAARQAVVVDHIEIILVPAGEPRTKPKACNYGLEYARGEFVTIYDAEDEPDPLQLRRAVVAFRRGGPRLACIQAQLTYHNSGQNILTAWFAVEYLVWFRFMLPGLDAFRALIPLGGTSNHIRRSVLDEVGAWDPFNVTEDADLGARIAHAGYLTGVLASPTAEEANSDVINWVRQRSRWHKGYLQTVLVHLRRPVTLARAIGGYNVIRFILLLGGTPILAVANASFWVLALVWILAQPAAIAAIFPWYVLYPATISLVFGNLSVIYLNLVACYVDRRYDLVVASVTAPLYWVLMSVGAIKGAIQLITQPSYWEKTVHGLSDGGEG
jgi:cellulose synthase/poly-beta-1,6-N-acetylglucosamine synthase-like glycosyltransferase